MYCEKDKIKKALAEKKDATDIKRQEVQIK